MTPKNIRAIASDILGGIAPEADLTALSDDDELREVLDLDSMDFLNFVTGLHAATGLDIPESDYRKLFTMRGVVAFFCQH